MSFNLVETLQQNLGYPQLQKIDPNTQLVTENETGLAEDKLSQAAIPAVLSGLYRYVQKDEGAEEILQVANSSMWINKFFDAEKKTVVQTISDYSSQSHEEVELQMNAIANEAVKLIKENLAGNADRKEVKLFLSNQKNDILLYLLPALNMGLLLHDNTLDDNTHKMQGPVSGLIQNIGALFSSPVSGEEIKNH